MPRLRFGLVRWAVFEVHLFRTNAKFSIFVLTRRAAATLSADESGIWASFKKNGNCDGFSGCILHVRPLG
jgi:hypothetical protein